MLQKFQAAPSVSNRSTIINYHQNLEPNEGGNFWLLTMLLPLKIRNENPMITTILKQLLNSSKLIRVSNKPVKQTGTNWFSRFFSSGDKPIRVSPSEVLRIWGEVTERMDLLHKSCAKPAPAQRCKLPFCPFQSTDEGLYSLNKIAGFIFPYVRFVTQFEQYFAF